jgi:hypothetical protein
MAEGAHSVAAPPEICRDGVESDMRRVFVGSSRIGGPANIGGPFQEATCASQGLLRGWMIGATQ